MKGMLKNVGDAISSRTQGIQKNSPEILLVGGVVGLVVSGVLACIATRKLDEVLEDVSIEVEAAHAAHENTDITEEGRTDASLRKDLAMAYGKGALNVARLYAVPAGIATVSVLAIFGSHNIMTKRSVALAAAYSALDKGFKKYRGRVVEKFGEEVDRQLLYGVEKQRITEEEVDPETGKKRKSKKGIGVIKDPKGICSPYARFFDDASREWKPDPEYNLMFLRSQQASANNMLRQKGKLCLNDVLEMLDIPKFDGGQLVGWKYDKDRANGDNIIDFGIYNTKRAESRDFVNGYEDCILLDFNVDGLIVDINNLEREF